LDTNVSELQINGVAYVLKNSQPQIQPNGPTKIVILQRGWVMVGRLERNGSDCKLHNASVIRIWGTKKGLGEIASNGPTKDTVLDKCGGVVEFDYLTTVAVIAVEESKWAKEL
jgi:hypothetical protein